MTLCDPNLPGCAKRTGAIGPDFCGECGLARVEYSAPPSAPSTPPAAPQSRPSPLQPRQARPVVPMKSAGDAATQRATQNPGSAQSTPTPTPAQQPVGASPPAPQPAPASSPVPQPAQASPRVSSSLSQILLTGKSGTPVTGKAGTPPAPTPPKVRRPRRRRRVVLALGAVATILAGAVTVVIRTDFIDELIGQSASTQAVEGVVNDELLRLASEGSPTIKLGTNAESVSEGKFGIEGAAEHTGLASVVDGDYTLGISLVPKSRALKSPSIDVSFESTAIALVLLRPEISNVLVLGNPVLDAAAYELLLTSDAITDVISELRNESASEGREYLEDLSPTTEARIIEATEWFREQVSGESSGGDLSRRRIRDGSREADLAPFVRPPELPQTCDEGLLPRSFGEADGLCVNVVSPKRDDWEKFDFSKDMAVQIRNLSPRAAAIFFNDGAGSHRFVGYVPPLDLTLPNASEYLLAFSDEAVTKFFEFLDVPGLTLDEGVDDAQSTELTLQGISRDSVLTTISFDWPGVPGINNQEFDDFVAANNLAYSRNLAFALTLLSTYVLPIIGVVLDSRDVGGENNPTLNEVISDCSRSLMPELFKSAADSYLGSESSWDLGDLMNAEGGVPVLFWMIVLGQFSGSECEELEANARVISGCYPSLGSFFSSFATLVDDSDGVTSCIGDFRDELVERFLVPPNGFLFKETLKKIADPLEKVDVGLQILSVARSAAASLGDAKRFADGDQYELRTVADVPRWCYEIAASSSRIVGVYGFLDLDSSGNLAEQLRELIQGLIVLVNQIDDLSDKLADDSFWEREARAWETIATVAPEELRPDAKAVAEFFREIAKVDVYALDKFKAIRVALRLRDLLARLNELQNQLQRIDEVVMRDCPQFQTS